MTNSDSYTKSQIHRIFRLNGADFESLAYLDELLDSSEEPKLDSVEYANSWIHDNEAVARIVTQIEAL